MGRKRHRAGGKSGGGGEDDYGDGLDGPSDQYGSLVERDRDDHFGGRGGKGGGGLRGGGSAGGPSRGGGPDLQAAHKVPKFLQGFAHLLQREGFHAEARAEAEKFSKAEALQRYGDDDDVEAGERRGLGGANAGTPAARVDEQALASEEKGKGNRAFQERRYGDAVRHFTAAFAADPTMHLALSNRSAAHAALEDWDAALKDAQRVVSMAPDFAKGYSRVGAAHLGLKDYTSAREAYAEAARLDPEHEPYSRAAADAAAKEQEALQSGAFVFKASAANAQPKRPRKQGGAGVRDAAKLSFGDDDDDGEGDDES